MRYQKKLYLCIIKQERKSQPTKPATKKMTTQNNTNDYKAKQNIARQIEDYANTDRIYQNSFFNIAFNDLGSFISKIMKLEVFAAQVAATVDKSMNPYNRYVAKVSSKQAWILACAAFENGIELN